MNNILSAFVFSLVLVSPVIDAAEEQKIVEHNQMMDHGDGHMMDMEGGMVMGQNKDKLPAGCDKVSEDVKIEVHAGRKYSKTFPGTIFGFDQHEWRVKPCTRLTVSFVNEDNVRHQWMMHGLPKFMYDKGMFHLEATGPAKVVGTLILPAEDKTYLVHCDIAQHMEKGMKGQLIVGKGSGTFPTIPGITDPAISDNYGPGITQTQNLSADPSVMTSTAPALQMQATAAKNQPTADEPTSFFSGSLIIGLLMGFLGTPYMIMRCKDKTGAEILDCILKSAKDCFNDLVKFVAWLFRHISRGKFLPRGKSS